MQESQVSSTPPNEKIVRRHSGVVRRASVLNTQEQRAAERLSAKASKKPKEHRAVGSVDKNVYKNYVKSNGVIGVIIYLLTLAMVQGCSIGTNVWLKNWAQASRKLRCKLMRLMEHFICQANTETGSNNSLPYYLGIYFTIGLTTALLYFGNSVLLSCVCVVRSARYLHDGMYASVMRAPLQFFESTTVGTILNRFSRDVTVADEILSRVFGGFWRTAFQVTGVILVVSFAVPLFLVVIIP